MASVKTIGASGQISLGKKYARRHVLIDEVERGVWVVKPTTEASRDQR